MRLLSIRYCYYVYAQPKHNVTTWMLSIHINFQHFLLVTMLILSIRVVTICICWAYVLYHYAYAEHTRSNNRRMLSMRITIEKSNILANFWKKWKSLEIRILIYAKKTPSKISRLGTFNWAGLANSQLVRGCQLYELVWQVDRPIGSDRILAV